jgi:DNA primase
VGVAGRILKDDIEALRQQADIVAVVGDHTTLRRAGRSFKGLCPFHTEKTPSFTVTPEGNFFHCFGCGASGDLYDFLMRVEGLEFPEAVESLARRTGYTLRYEQLSARERRVIGERSRLVEVTAAAREHLHQTLLGDEGEVARAYLRDRGFGREDAERFTLGFATLARSALTDTLTAAGFDAADLVAVGLSVRNENGRLRDRFRGRLIFPIDDASGDVIGFGGRILPDLDYGDFEPPKYLNSPETPLYKKTRVLYGLRQARPEIVRADQVLVCEGYTDVMALHQAGIEHAVATCGTAVGDEHLRLIARYARRVVLAFDGDEAGVKAAERAWEAARRLATDDGGSVLELRVLVLADGRDPADLVREAGADGLRDALQTAQPIVPFVVGHRLADADLVTESVAGPRRCVRRSRSSVASPTRTCAANGRGPRSPTGSAWPTTSWPAPPSGWASSSTPTTGWPCAPDPGRRRATAHPGRTPCVPASSGRCCGSPCSGPSCSRTSGTSSPRPTSSIPAPARCCARFTPPVAQGCRSTP